MVPGRSLYQREILKTIFITADGSYELSRMPFGMINSEAMLKHAMKRLLKELPNVEFYWPGQYLGPHPYMGRASRSPL